MPVHGGEPVARKDAHPVSRAAGHKLFDVKAREVSTNFTSIVLLHIIHVVADHSVEGEDCRVGIGGVRRGAGAWVDDLGLLTLLETDAQAGVARIRVGNGDFEDESPSSGLKERKRMGNLSCWPTNGLG